MTKQEAELQQQHQELLEREAKGREGEEKLSKTQHDLEYVHWHLRLGGSPLSLKAYIGPDCGVC